jgi:hypothetical protein
MPASLFPSYSIFDSLLLAKTICEKNGGRPMRRLTLFDALNRSPDSGTSRSLVTASSGYGLTQGGYSADEIKLTEQGRAIVEENNTQALLDSVLSIGIFKAFFDNYKNSTVPLEKAAIDFLVKQGLTEKTAKTCLNIILANGEQLHLIQEISGTKRIVSPEHALEKLRETSFNAESNKPDGGDRKKEEQIQNKGEQEISHHPAPKSASQNAFVPNLHIDIQIHIASDAKTDQIEQIFASMAKYLYGKE